MFGDGPLSFREAMMREPLPLVAIHDAILFDFLPGRDDAILFGVERIGVARNSPRRRRRQVRRLNTAIF